MITDELGKQYRAAMDTTSFAAHQKFIKLLLSSSEPDVIHYHCELLKNRENPKLYLRLRAAFKKRGPAGAKYLTERMRTEKNPQLVGDILHLLGGMGEEASLPLARQLITSSDADLRDKATYVLGWVGKESDTELLGNRLLNDPDPKVRADAATAHDQMRMRLPQIKDQLLGTLKRAVELERDEQVLAWIIITLQNFLGKKFGLKEDIEEGTYSGNVHQAREKARAALSTLPV
jgi:HEAT repeat protein